MTILNEFDFRSLESGDRVVVTTKSGTKYDFECEAETATQPYGENSHGGLLLTRISEVPIDREVRPIVGEPAWLLMSTTKALQLGSKLHVVPELNHPSYDEARQKAVYKDEFDARFDYFHTTPVVEIDYLRNPHAV
ncbi:MAG: hypothetical protein JWO47_409 [Candidatus Saccharibacteria bacterium]|nr:hypothetical protein [Candidatus Saccharibacteria bacterium]